MNEKLVLVASNDDIFTYAREIVVENQYDAILVYGELEGALAKVKRILDQKDFRVFVSRGGTAKLLREHFGIPIVEIAVTAHDILKAIHPLVRAGKKVAVIGFANVISGARQLAEIMGLDIMYVETVNSEAVPGALQAALDANVDVIVGDHHIERRASALGVNAVRIDSGRESVKNALEEAARLHSATVIERMENRRYFTIMESIEEGIIAINEAGNITVFNPGAEKIFNIPESEVIGKPVEVVIPQTFMLQVLRSGTEMVGALMDLGKTSIASSVKPIIVDGKVEGVVSTFRDITKIQQLEAKIRAEVVKKRLSAKKSFDDIVYASPKMGEVIDQARKYAEVDSTLLIFGESGTGKEVMAQALHNNSPRRDAPFVAVNCAALPDNLLESELFGYVEGSFTGARKEGKKGLFEMAHGGSIFLDEISEMALPVQARILRVIQEKEVMRLGDDKIVPVDVRILAATNKRLWHCVQSGTFRQDLFYRLNVLNLNLPPLRERMEDVPPLARLFLREFSGKYATAAAEMTDNDKALMLRHNWPGNVRELQNVMERYVISGKLLVDNYDALGGDEEDILEAGSLEDIEALVVKKILEQEGFNKANTAKRLGISRTTLDKKIR